MQAAKMINTHPDVKGIQHDQEVQQAGNDHERVAVLVGRRRHDAPAGVEGLGEKPWQTDAEVGDPGGDPHAVYRHRHRQEGGSAKQTRRHSTHRRPAGRPNDLVKDGGKLVRRKQRRIGIPAAEGNDRRIGPEFMQALQEGGVRSSQLFRLTSSQLTQFLS